MLMDWETIAVPAELKNGLKLEAEKQHRSVANLVQWILAQAGIKEMSDQELEKQIKKLEISP